MKELYHISFSGYRFTIEPRWNLFFRYFTTPFEFWWEESIRVSSDGRNCIEIQGFWEFTKTFFYYILNPLLLLMKRDQKI